jgi:hypothetical protein
MLRQHRLAAGCRLTGTLEACLHVEAAILAAGEGGFQPPVETL